MSEYYFTNVDPYYGARRVYSYRRVYFKWGQNFKDMQNGLRTDEYTIKLLSFKDNDSIHTTQVVNFKPRSPYCVLWEIKGSENSIISCWFIVNYRKLRTNQYLLELKRDSIVDRWDAYRYLGRANMYVEKGWIKDINDPLIFNKEDVTLNQIKRKEITLFDYSGCGWIIGFCPKTVAGKTINVQIPDKGVAASETYNSLNDYPYYQYNNKNICLNSSVTWQLGTIINKSSGVQDNIALLLQTNNYNDFTYNHGADANGDYGYYLGDEIETQYLKELSEKVYGDNSTSIFKALAPNREIADLDTYRKLIRENGKIIKVGTTFYKVKASSINVWDDKRVTSANEINAINTLLNKTGSLEMGRTYSILGEPNERTFLLIDRYTGISFSLEEIYTSLATTIPASIPELNDQPYCMFCMPYDDNLLLSGGATASKEVALQIASKIASIVGDNAIYDVQLAPYCPMQNIIKESGGINYNSAIYNEVKDSNETAHSVMVWCTHSNFSITINCERWSRHDALGTIPKFTYYDYTDGAFEKQSDPLELKVANQSQFIRIVSPDYSKIYEMSPQMNGGITSFNIDCTYMPFNSYCQIQPNFGGLYGKDFNDARGLIFTTTSLAQVSSAWANYQLQNKNYNLIFNREIAHQETQNQYERINQMVSMISGSMTAGATAGAGAMMVTGNPIIGGVAAGAGAVASMIGGAADMYLSEKMRQENLNYSKDMFRLNLGNIQALPNSLTRSGNLTRINKVAPVIEIYDCTEKEKEYFRKKLEYDGMTIGVATESITQYIEDGKYFKGQIIYNRLLGKNTDINLINDTSIEFAKGVYTFIDSYL